jgi:hypothetical protein
MADVFYNFNVILQRNAQSQIGIDTSKLYGYWERADGSEGGGLWFEPSTETKTGLNLIDADGGYELPTAVVNTLHHNGFISDDTLDEWLVD